MRRCEAWTVQTQLNTELYHEHRMSMDYTVDFRPSGPTIAGSGNRLSWWLNWTPPTVVRSLP